MAQLRTRPEAGRIKPKPTDDAEPANPSVLEPSIRTVPGNGTAITQLAEQGATPAYAVNALKLLNYCAMRHIIE